MNAPIDIPAILAPVMRVMPENITPLWPQLEPLLRAALTMVSTHTAEDVRRSLMAMRAQLWAQMNGNRLEAAATTEFVDYPVGMYVRVWHAGALKGCRMNTEAFFEVLDAWRMQNDCIGFEAIGRHGWARRFPEARIEGLILRWQP